ncbi:NUMOD4 domain-containing protein [Epilithonimonas hominis]|uniref:NUMOD4 domain-containing protein n=1 Tax=Epilithonimonas hominis TaxID=420404 RepID=UPI002899D48F|nr:NUMOD4 domain-containing protein [Epilithonimonas hominis]
MDAVNGEFLTAGGFRWFLQSQPPQEDDFVILKSESSNKIFNQSLWNHLGKPLIDKENPLSCLNLSLEDMPEEHWKPIPGFDNRFAISDKGRVKRLSGWTLTGRKVFLKEQILAQYMGYSNGKPSLYCILRHNQKNTCKCITKLLYCCFVQEFDMYDNRIVVINKSKPFWNVDISKLSLHSIHSVLKGKEE